MNKHHHVVVNAAAYYIYPVIPVGCCLNLVLVSILCRSRTIPRTVWITCTQIIMIITYLLLAFAIDGTLYVAIAFLGICFGVQFSIMIPTVSELFGLKNFGLISNFMALGNPIGAFLFSGLLAGYVYDNEAAKQHGLVRYGSSLSCLGPNCFRITFLVLAVVCAVGTILSIVLTRRIKPVYQMLYSGGSFRLPPSTFHWDWWCGVYIFSIASLLEHISEVCQ